jgi:hypothetical protein
MTNLVEEPEAKYVVFKLEEWNRWAAEEETGGVGTPPVELDGAVVIRLKDPFAATALFSYANTIMSFLELMEETMDEGEHARMLDIADYFHQQAVESQKIKNKRLPD